MRLFAASIAVTTDRMRSTRFCAFATAFSTSSQTIRLAVAPSDPPPIPSATQNTVFASSTNAVSSLSLRTSPFSFAVT